MNSVPLRKPREPEMRIDPDEGLERAVTQAAEIVAERARALIGVPDAEVNVAELRGALGMTQARFAAVVGIPIGTVRNWEQGRRRPEGPARVLLQLIAANPEGALRTLAAESETKA
ncbi:helix-turn-helix domain-containing protein [bacterium]|nr:helix-turn-helix domain-containing protein [bacterium]